MAEKYRVETGDPLRDRERILDLWQRCDFTSGTDPGARYDWFYLRNPRGNARVYLLVENETGELAGAMGAGPRLFVRGPGEPPLRAAVLVDFVVLPAHRSMFPALQLQRAAREGELRDVDIVYGLPDVKAVPIFNRLGATLRLDSGNHVRVLRSADYAGRLLPKAMSMPVRLTCWFVDRARVLLLRALCGVYGVRATWHRELPEGLDALWELSGKIPGRPMGERDREYLRWRFSPSMHSDWLVLSVQGRRSVGLEAYFICRRDGQNLHVHDFLLADTGAALAPKFLALALASWSLEVGTARIVFGGSEQVVRAMIRAGFLLRDQRPCYLMAANGAAADSLPQRWWLTKADEDV